MIWPDDCLDLHFVQRMINCFEVPFDMSDCLVALEDHVMNSWTAEMLCLLDVHTGLWMYWSDSFREHLVFDGCWRTLSGIFVLWAQIGDWTVYDTMVRDCCPPC